MMKDITKIIVDTTTTVKVPLLWPFNIETWKILYKEIECKTGIKFILYDLSEKQKNVWAFHSDFGCLEEVGAKHPPPLLNVYFQPRPK